MIRQSINLLPSSVHERTSAGLRTGRYVASILAGVVMLSALTVHARVLRGGLRESLATAQAKHDEVIRMERRIAHIRSESAELDRALARYRAIAQPIEFAGVIATIANRLPEGAAIDRIDVEATSRRTARSARTAAAPAGATASAPARPARIEISGLAQDDRAVAGFVAELQALEFTETVTLDFSRTRLVRGIPARDFRVTIRIDLDRIAPMAVASAGGHS